MLRLNHHRYPGGMEHLHQGVRNLDGEVLLDLQAAREHVHDPRDLRETDDFPIRDVSHVRLAEKGKQMMLAHRIELDVFDEHDLARLGIEDRFVDQGFEILAIPGGEELEGPRRAIWGFQQALAFWIFANRFEQTAERVLHAGQLRRRARPQTRYAAFGRL